MEEITKIEPEKDWLKQFEIGLQIGNEMPVGETRERYFLELGRHFLIAIKPVWIVVQNSQNTEKR